MNPAILLLPLCLLANPQDSQDSAEAARLARARNANDFALRLHRELAARHTNVFASPHSITTAFAMTWACCQGDSHRELARALGFAAEPEVVHRALAELNAALVRVSEGSDVELALANRLWGSSLVPADYYQQPLLAFLGERYGAPFGRLDFSDEPRARATINGWVSERTRKRVPELIPEGVLGPMTALVLVNAIYFKGAWKDPFAPEHTRTAPFHAGPEESIPVAMMNRLGRYPALIEPEVSLVELPYAGDQLRMLALLPGEGRSLAELEAGLTAGKLGAWAAKMRPRTVRLAFPRFRLESHVDLVPEVLPSMGMRAPLRPTYDWRPLNAGRESIFISNVFHGAFVEVDEKGSEAAGATAVLLGRGGRPPALRFDRPFLFLIQHRQSGLILFLGRLAKPAPVEGDSR